VPDSIHAALASLPGPVLLVDDLLDTGWTATVAAMRLRAAGATGVLPMVLATATS
jgi:ATP-dependent DNA helicase RecQ